MKAVSFFLSLFGILLIVAAVILYGGPGENQRLPSENPDTRSETIQTSPEGTLKEDENKNTDESLGEESSSSSIKQTPDNCKTVLVSYSLSNFLEMQECLNILDGICMQKNLRCSADLSNLDDFTSGQFIFDFIFLEELTGEEIQKVQQTKYLSPKQSARLEAETTINSEGEEGNANRKIKCTLSPTKLPTKEIC